jgi:sensor domain CHASE-containing protein
MNRKIFGNVLATAFLAGALAACSSSSSEQTEEEQAKAEQAEAQEQEQDRGDDRTSTSAWWGDNLAGYWYVLKRDMKQLYQSIDRHVFNYDWEDPYLN